MANRASGYEPSPGIMRGQPRATPQFSTRHPSPGILQRMPLPRRSRVPGGAGPSDFAPGKALGAKSSRLRMAAPSITEFPRQAMPTAGEPVSSATFDPAG